MKEKIKITKINNSNEILIIKKINENKNYYFLF